MKTSHDNWKSRLLLFSAIAGAVTGLGVAFMLIKRAEKQENRVQLTTGEGVQIGLGVLGLLRLVNELGSTKKLK